MSTAEAPHPAGTISGGEPSHGRGRIALHALFAVYLVLLAWIVMWKLEVPFVGAGALRQIKLVPFAPSSCDGASAPSEVVANLVLFVPFGLYLGLLAPTWRWWRVAAVVAGASLVLEVGQYVLAVGSSDVTDLITNTAGALAGLGLLALARRRFRTRAVAVVTRICAALTVVALLATAIVFVSPLSFAPPRDYLVSAPGGPGAGAGALSDERRWADRDARAQRCRENPF